MKQIIPGFPGPLPVLNITFPRCMVCPNNMYALGPLNLSDHHHHHRHQYQKAAVKQIINPSACQLCPPDRVSLAASASPNDCGELFCAFVG